jgi:putative ABC transport system ATP-binding protein
MEKPPAPENLALDSAVAAASQRLGTRVGFVPQTLGLAPWLTAAENVALVLQVLRLPSIVVRDRTAAVLAAVGLGGTADRIVAELSGGQRQRVAVARSLAAEPDVLIADEPTAELDAENRQLILDLLLGAASDGAAVIVATHDPDVSVACETAYELRNGKLEMP